MAQARKSPRKNAQGAQSVNNPQYTHGAQNQPINNGQFIQPHPDAQPFPDPAWGGQQSWQQAQQPQQQYQQPQQQGFEVNDNTGGLFTNNRKNPGSRQPDYTGNACINGVMYWVSGWMRRSRSGMSYMSLAFTEQDQTQHPHQDMNAPAPMPFM